MRKGESQVRKNSRPDIQVLEDRIVRLKAQLLEYKDIRLYKATKSRLATVSAQLAECISIINGVVNSDPNVFGQPSFGSDDEFDSERIEFNEDGDLADSFLTNSDKGEPQIIQGLSAKQLVGMFSAKLKEGAELQGTSTGIIQVNQFWQLLNSWYQTRFTPETRNPNFHFKANRIHEWIDLLIIAAGHALHDGLFPAFVSDMNAWIANLNTEQDEGWILPYSVMRMQRLSKGCCTREAVLIEDMIKPYLYDWNFYPQDLHSVYKIVITTGGFSDDDLQFDAIIRDCPKLLRTSSFDPTKYQRR